MHILFPSTASNPSGDPYSWQAITPCKTVLGQTIGTPCWSSMYIKSQDMIGEAANDDDGAAVVTTNPSTQWYFVSCIANSTGSAQICHRTLIVKLCGVL